MNEWITEALEECTARSLDDVEDRRAVAEVLTCAFRRTHGSSDEQGTMRQLRIWLLRAAVHSAKANSVDVAVFLKAYFATLQVMWPKEAA